MSFSNSDPPLEEDEVPPGEWRCHRCKIAPPKPEVGRLLIRKIQVMWIDLFVCSYI